MPSYFLHTIGVLGTGVPRLACLRPAVWRNGGPNMAHLHQHKTQDHREGPSLVRRMTQRILRRSLIRLAREEVEISRRGTSRGAHDVSHDDPGYQAGASVHNVLLSSSVQRGQAQPRGTEASGKGCHFGATRPGPSGLRDGGHHGAQHGVITRAFGRRRLLLSG